MTVILATFMEVLDTSVANVSLPHIAGNLSASVDESTWVLTSYLVSNAIVLPLTGWFSRLVGRRNFFIGCVVIFTISSLLCGLSLSLPMLVFFRVLQGAGGGGLQPVSQAILVDSFPREKQGMAMAIYGMGVVVAPTIGPTIGGWITDNYTWRWIFLINVPVGILAVMLTSVLISDPPHAARKRGSAKQIDYIGLGLLSVGLGFAQVVLDKGQRDDWFGSHFIVWSTAAAVAGLIGMVIWELHVTNPVVELRLLKERNFAVATFMMYTLGFVLYGTTVLLPILLQTLMGYTAKQSGLVIFPGGVATLCALPLVGRLLAKFEARWMVVFGMLILSTGLIEMSHMTLDVSMRTPIWDWAVSRFGVAFLFVPVNVMAFFYVPRHETNQATGLINLARNIGGSMGISFVTTMLERRAQFHQNILASHTAAGNPRYQAAIQHLSRMFAMHGLHGATATHQAQTVIYGNVQRQAMMLSFVDNFWLMAMICLAVIPLLFLMKKMRPGRAQVAVH